MSNDEKKEIGSEKRNTTSTDEHFISGVLFSSLKQQAILYGCRSCSWSPSSTCYHRQETVTRFLAKVRTKTKECYYRVRFWTNVTDLSSSRIRSSSKHARRSGLFRHHVVVWLRLRTKGSKHFLSSVHWIHIRKGIGHIHCLSKESKTNSCVVYYL